MLYYNNMNGIHTIFSALRLTSISHKIHFHSFDVKLYGRRGVSFTLSLQKKTFFVSFTYERCCVTLENTPDRSSPSL